jgi:CHAD domain-containing protein
MPGGRNSKRTGRKTVIDFQPGYYPLMAKTRQLPPRMANAAIQTFLERLIVLRLGEIKKYRHGVEEGTIDAVHDMRVSCRRLQAALKVFRSYFHKKRIKTIQRPLRALIGALGTVREYDVLMRSIMGHVKPATPRQRMTLGLFVGRYSLLRAHAHRSLVRLLPETEGMFVQPGQLKRLFAQKDGGPIATGTLFKQAVPALFAKFVFASTPVVNHPRRIAALHRLRIKGKPLRYILELSASWFGKPYLTGYQEVKSAIELLGDIHDIDVARGLLREHLKEIRFVNARTASPAPDAMVPAGFIRAAIKTLGVNRNGLFDRLNATLERWRTVRFGDRLTGAMEQIRKSGTGRERT